MGDQRWDLSTDLFSSSIKVIKVCLFLFMISSWSQRVFSEIGNGGERGALSPVRHFEESLAASSAHGTVIAIRVRLKGFLHEYNNNEGGSGQNDADHHEEGIVILCQSPSESIKSKLTLPPNVPNGFDEIRQNGENNNPGECTNENMIMLTPGPINISPASSGMINILHDNCIVTMTGLAADVRHIVRSSVMSIQRHYHVLQGTMPIKKVVVNTLSQKLSNAAMAGGGRPYGVQALVVGKNGFVSTTSGNTFHQQLINQQCLQLYTIDPSGSYVHWSGAATSIGKNAEWIRRRLESLLKITTRDADIVKKGDVIVKSEIPGEQPRNLTEGLAIAIRVALEASDVAIPNDNLKQLTNIDDFGDTIARESRQFAAFAIVASNHNQRKTQCWAFHPRTITNTVHACALDIQSSIQSVKRASF